MTRVLMTVDAVGGVWTYALSLIRSMPEVEFHLAVMGPPPREVPTGVSVRHMPFRLEWMDEPWEDVARAGAWLRQIERELEPDLVHLNGYAHAALPWRVPVLCVAHSCVLSWWEAVRGEAAPSGWSRYRDAVADGLAAANAVVAPSYAMLGALARHYPRPRRHLVIPNGIDLSAYAPARKRSFVLAAGRVWDEAKNFADLDAPLAWPVEIAGDATHPGGVNVGLRHATALGVLPPEALRERMARAAIFAHPARYEPFGLSVLEAAASGCALVLGDIPSLRELWDGAAVFGLDNLPRLVEDTALREEYGRRARHRAQRFSIGETAAAYLALYRELASRAREAA